MTCAHLDLRSFPVHAVEWVLGQRKLIEEGLEKAVQAAGLEEDPNAPANAVIIDERMAAIIDADGDGVVSAAEAAEIASSPSAAAPRAACAAAAVSLSLEIA